MLDQISGPGKDNVEAFRTLHRGTDNFVEHSLDPSSHAKMLASSNPASDGFDVLSKFLCRRYTIGEQWMKVFQHSRKEHRSDFGP